MEIALTQGLMHHASKLPVPFSFVFVHPIWLVAVPILFTQRLFCLSGSVVVCLLTQLNTKHSAAMSLANSDILTYQSTDRQAAG